MGSVVSRSFSNILISFSVAPTMNPYVNIMLVYSCKHTQTHTYTEQRAVHEKQEGKGEVGHTQPTRRGKDVGLPSFKVIRGAFAWSQFSQSSHILFTFI